MAPPTAIEPAGGLPPVESVRDVAATENSTTTVQDAFLPETFIHGSTIDGPTFAAPTEVVSSDLYGGPPVPGDAIEAPLEAAVSRLPAVEPVPPDILARAADTSPLDTLPEFPRRLVQTAATDTVEITGLQTFPATAAVGNESPLPVSHTPAAAPSAPATSGISRRTFLIVASWASAMTLAVIFLLQQRLMPNVHELESLPDLKPPKKKDTIAYRLVPQDAGMPRGHSLELQEARRFGHLKVTPLRVTRGPLEFEHHLKDQKHRRAPEADVIKLWLRFENMSADQHIAPLDGLVFRRVQIDETERSNNFLARVSQKHSGGTAALVYDLNENDIWNLKGQDVDREIAPGESIETYIPAHPRQTGPVLGSAEDLVWRVHFRKGYSPQQFGVTTIIEVVFPESAITTESAPAATSGV